MTRRFELDWLRLFLFGLLVPYHAALGFVSYGADVYGIANDELGGEGLELLLDWSHSWRIFALFMISGVGTWFASRKGAGWGFAKSRLHRLGLPLIGWVLFALIAIFAIGWDAQDFFYEGAWGFTTIGFWHLWFIKYLLIYTFISIPLLRRPNVLRMNPDKPFQTVVLISIAMFVANALIQPVAELVFRLDGDDTYNFMGFVLGIWIGANAARLLDWMAKYWWIFLLSGTASYPLTLMFQMAVIEMVDPQDQGWALYGRLDYLAWHAVRPVNGLIWGMGWFGLFARFFNKPGRYLARLNKLVFPLYVFHMPLTMAGIAIAATRSGPWLPELLWIIAGTYFASIFLALIAERLGPAAYLFGATPRR